ncbi:MAG: sulfatase-like hydrolase/transferase [Deltaproteobacteria bacterium]|nr:sulfatase-like hydrolase/transferase [Deltaproteobacteria bacterium]
MEPRSLWNASRARELPATPQFPACLLPLLCLLALLVAFACDAGAPPSPPSPPSPPNVVILLADDLGWNDVGYHGSEIRTPHIDALAREGVRLERFYVSPICSPTRAGLLTGRWPIRYGLMKAVIPPWSRYGLPVGEHTLAELFEKAGYTRRALVGKWHLGHSRRAQHPLERGFSEFYGHYNGAIGYFDHRRLDEVDWHRGWKTLHEEGYSTDLLADEAVRFLRDSQPGEPFFLYVAFNAPHKPLQAKPEDLARYPQLRKPRKTYAAMVDSLDQAVGRILDTLDERGLAEETFVLFLSDNGGEAGIADNSPLRGAKSSVHEGGIRVPAIVRWPRGGLAGAADGVGGAEGVEERSVEEPMGYIDVYPTLKRVAGAEFADPEPLDGHDVLDIMAGQDAAPDRRWYSFLAPLGPEEIAVQQGPWKLVVKGPSILLQRPPRPWIFELYRIDRDPGETTNLADRHPERVTELLDDLRAFRALQPGKGVAAYPVGQEGFVAPTDWQVGR